MTSKILYLSAEDMTDHARAARTHVSEIVEGLRRRGWIVELMTPSTRRWLGGRVVSRVLNIAGMQLRALRRFWPADVIYVRNHPLLALPVMASWLLRKPVVLEVNGTPADAESSQPWVKRFRPISYAFYRLVLRLADAVIVVTDGLAAHVGSLTNHHSIHVVPNAADVALFTPDARSDFSGVIERPYVIFFGNFATWQGIPTIIAAATSDAWPPHVNLLFVGDGVDRTAVEGAAARYGHIRYIGKVEQTDLPHS